MKLTYTWTAFYDENMSTSLDGIDDGTITYVFAERDASSDRKLDQRISDSASHR